MIFQILPKLSVARLLEICRRLIGKLFHKRGLATAKLLSPNLLWVRAYKIRELVVFPILPLSTNLLPI